MIKYLSALVTSVISLVSLIISSIESFLNLVLNIPTYLTFISSSIGFLPDIVVPFALATISIIVVLFIVGR